MTSSDIQLNKPKLLVNWH